MSDITKQYLTQYLTEINPVMIGYIAKKAIEHDSLPVYFYRD